MDSHLKVSANADLLGDEITPIYTLLLYFSSSAALCLYDCSSDKTTVLFCEEEFCCIAGAASPLIIELCKIDL